MTKPADRHGSKILFFEILKTENSTIDAPYPRIWVKREIGVKLEKNSSTVFDGIKVSTTKKVGSLKTDQFGIVNDGARIGEVSKGFELSRIQLLKIYTLRRS